jgi:hypothetical protein
MDALGLPVGRHGLQVGARRSSVSTITLSARSLYTATGGGVGAPARPATRTASPPVWSARRRETVVRWSWDTGVSFLPRPTPVPRP